MAKAKTHTDTEASEFEDPDATAKGVGFEHEGGSVDTEDGDGPEVDLSTTGEGLFPVLPRGIYNASVEQLEYSRSQRSNNPMWTWRFEIEDGEFAGRKLFYHTVFNEGGMPRVKRTLARIKTDDNYEQSLLETRFHPGKVAEEGRLLGARCRIRLDVRKYEGELRNEIKDVLAPAAAGGFDE